MQQDVRIECPRCGRPLQRFNGKIGYCSQHKWVSPSGLGFDAEAAEQNQQEELRREKRRLKRKRLRAEEDARIQQENQHSAVRKALFVVITIFAIAAIAVVFLVKPSVNYRKATDLFTAKEYELAQEKYEPLGDYKDSSSRAVLGMSISK